MAAKAEGNDVGDLERLVDEVSDEVSTRPRLRLLLDTNLLVRAAITPEGLARRILQLIADDPRHVLILSTHLLAEVADVLSRP